MFINTKKTFSIKSENGTPFEARVGWIGEIPKWVEEHWFFKALCKDGSVTAIVSKRDKDINVVPEESLAKASTDTPVKPAKADVGTPEIDKPPVKTELPKMAGKAAK